MVPFTGGIYSAALIAETILLKRKQAIIFALIGMLIGNCIFTLGAKGIIYLTF